MFSIALSLEKGLQVRMGDSEVALDVLSSPHFLVQSVS